LAGNTLAIRENNKAIIDNMFTGNKVYDENLNKKFLNQYLEKNFNLEKDVAQKEIDSWSKKDIRKEYAKA
jgi:c-di-AMP phosphodiesterase-like protein